MRGRGLTLLLYLLPPLVLAASLLVGPADSVAPGQVVRWWLGLIGGRPDPALDPSLLAAVVWDVRLPRILLTFLVGAALSGSGAALQGLFRNPLVDPYLLGLAPGAAVGAALALFLPWLPLQPAAFACALLAVGLSYVLARHQGAVSVVSLILAGIIVSGVMTAVLTIVQFVADPFKLQTIVHWTMGNLHNASWDKLYSAAPLILPALAALWLLRWRLNVLALGDEETRSVGLNPELQKLLILVPATLAASAAVAVAGVIGLVGLVVPHMVRMLLGPDNLRALPASLALGGVFLLLVDDCSRSLAAFEIPVGVFTTLLGGPFFIFLLKKARTGWEV